MVKINFIAGPEIAVAVQKIFAAAEVPIAWEPVDVAPIRNADGTMGIPQVTNSVHVFCCCIFQGFSLVSCMYPTIHDFVLNFIYNVQYLLFMILSLISCTMYNFYQYYSWFCPQFHVLCTIPTNTFHDFVLNFMYYV